jgi:predicted GNAT family N-acyltransferase
MTWEFVNFNKLYDRTKFDCGSSELNDYLKTKISKDVERRANVPLYAINSKNEVIGFYTLSSGSVQFQNFPEKLKNKIAPYPVSIARIGRLAVDVSMKGKGLGKELLFHALDRIEDVSKSIGIRAVIVDAKDKKAEDFYLKYGFEFLQNTTSSSRSMFIIL